MNRLFIIMILSICLAGSINADPMGDLASQMAPGTWAELQTNNFGNGSVFDDGATGGVLGYSDDAAWDPQTRKWFMAGAGHLGPGRFVSYDSATNRWTVMPYPSVVSDLGHAYDHNTVDPARAIFYHRKNGSREIIKYNIQSASWTTLPSNNLIPYVQCCGALEYFPEMGGLVFIPGAENGSISGIYFFGDNASQWTKLGTATMGQLHLFAEYNPVHKVIIFGGGNGSRDVYKLSSNGTISKMGNSPVELRIAESIVTVDPVSGEYLAFRGPNFYTYDVTTDVWRQQSGSGPFISPSWNGNEVFNTVATPVSTYGVTMFVKYFPGESKVYLYKHAEGGGQPPPPSPPPPSPPPSGELTFSEKCAQPGVVNCFGFNSESELYYTWPSGTACDQAFSGRSKYNFGSSRNGPGNTAATVQNGQCYYPEVDGSVFHSEGGSLKFTIPDKSSSNTSGFFAEVFERKSDGTFGYIGPGSPLGSVLYFQFYQRLDSNFLRTWFQCTSGSCTGWKQVIWYGNPPNGASSSSLEVTMNNGWQRGVPQMYGQQGSDAYGIQNVRGCKYVNNSCSTFDCIQAAYTEPPCIQFKDNVWMEFTGRIEIRGQPNEAASRVQLWVDGELVVDYGEAKIYWSTSGGSGNGLGQFQITPFHTRKDSSQSHPTGHTWYDDMVISTQPIPMRSGGSPPPPPPTDPPPAAPTGLTAN